MAMIEIIKPPKSKTDSCKIRIGNLEITFRQGKKRRLLWDVRKEAQVVGRGSLEIPGKLLGEAVRMAYRAYNEAERQPSLF
ncbi:hypothetical protein HY250_03630 [Candidatus Azambacteria bacterium]|nr:hypothetical protein [Candidatus Azambacteria bacterium]MBI3685467.1 hypothetical protein [Candidatus Azambacteria bacterium]